MNNKKTNNILFSDLALRKDGRLYQNHKNKAFTGSAKEIINNKIRREYEIENGNRL